jgi:hypothetical protein
MRTFRDAGIFNPPGGLPPSNRTAVMQIFALNAATRFCPNRG